MNRLFFFLLILAACKNSQEIIPEVKNAEPKILFVGLKIKRNAPDKQPILQLVQQTEVIGQFKKTNQTSFNHPNFLTLYAYQKEVLIDSVKIEHPLYKHFEFIDDHSKFSVKDTVIGQADFFVRFQATSKITEIKVNENVFGKKAIMLNSIKIDE